MQRRAHVSCSLETFLTSATRAALASCAGSQLSAVLRAVLGDRVGTSHGEGLR